jgi:hypothetical protein
LMFLWQAKDFIMFRPDVLCEEKRPKIIGLWGFAFYEYSLTSDIFQCLFLMQLPASKYRYTRKPWKLLFSFPLLFFVLTKGFLYCTHRINFCMKKLRAPLSPFRLSLVVKPCVYFN